MKSSLAVLLLLSAAPLIGAEPTHNDRGFIGEQNLQNAIRNGMGQALTGSTQERPRQLLQLPANRPLPAIKYQSRTGVCSIKLLEAQVPEHLDDRIQIPGKPPVDGGILLHSVPAPACAESSGANDTTPVTTSGKPGR